MFNIGLKIDAFPIELDSNMVLLQEFPEKTTGRKMGFLAKKIVGVRGYEDGYACLNRTISCFGGEFTVSANLHGDGDLMYGTSSMVVVRNGAINRIVCSMATMSKTHSYLKWLLFCNVCKSKLGDWIYRDISMQNMEMHMTYWKDVDSILSVSHNVTAGNAVFQLQRGHELIFKDDSLNMAL